jgi:hypothetical protein
MKCAFWFILACGPTDAKPQSVQRVQVVATTLRYCLRVAAGLKSKGDNAGAIAHVRACYQRHFVPMAPTLRARNPKATLSLEYGFGLLGHTMGKRQADSAALADQLADRVEAVVASLVVVELPQAQDSPPVD